MQLILKDIEFRISKAEFSARVSDPYWLARYDPDGDSGLIWSLEIQAERESNDEMPSISIYHEYLHFPVRRWVDVAGRSVEWFEPYDHQSGEPNGGCYIFHHGDVRQAQIHFLRRESDQIQFEWRGVCDIGWDDDYGSAVPFFASGWATFTRITVHGSEADTEESMRSRLTSLLEIDELDSSVLDRGGSYQDGVGMASMIFAPITQNPGPGGCP